jgi:outer membrane protein OmpA-like peptidoglycan-associated protein
MTMKKLTNYRLPLAAAAGLIIAALLGGCAAGGAQPHSSATSLRPNHSIPTDSDFPDPTKAFWKQGSFVSQEALRTMNVGMGKDQVRQLIGYPHFSEGLFGSREWNYLFHIRNGNSAEYVTCQYMVRFENDANNTPVSTGMYFKGPDCRARIMPVAARTVPPTPVAILPPEKVNLGSDGLFAFGKSSVNDMTAEGRARIDTIMNSVQQNFRSLNYVTITGHTDRLGNEADNLKLSQARAEAVRELLIAKGMDGRKIRTIGMGDKQPVKTCAEQFSTFRQGSAPSDALVGCLQANRRVELEIQGEY